jgi:hypothetical protein
MLAAATIDLSDLHPMINLHLEISILSPCALMFAPRPLVL